MSASMRIVTYNIRHGLGDDGRVDIDRFRRAVADLDADILALQETESGNPRSGRTDLTAVAAEAMGAVSVHFAPTVLRWRTGLWLRAGRPRPGAPRHPGMARYGIALLSRYPVTQWRRMELPLTPVRRRLTRRTSRWRAVLPDEPRAALMARIDTPQGPLTVVTTHLTAVAAGTADQLRALVPACAGFPRPLVLLGDLNLVAPTPRNITRWTPLADAVTFPVAHPTKQIDHILADAGGRGGHVVRRLGAARAVDTGLSDHRALVVDVALG